MESCLIGTLRNYRVRTLGRGGVSLIQIQAGSIATAVGLKVEHGVYERILMTRSNWLGLLRSWTCLECILFILLHISLWACPWLYINVIFLLFLIYVWVSLTMCLQYLQKPEEGIRFLETGVTGGRWPSKPGLWQEQPVLLMAESSFQPDSCILEAFDLVWFHKFTAGEKLWLRINVSCVWSWFRWAYISLWTLELMMGWDKSLGALEMW